jgi:hypothetical protein
MVFTDDSIFGVGHIAINKQYIEKSLLDQQGLEISVLA